jgi:uncharacterized tellurite resistance protein B-like protein
MIDVIKKFFSKVNAGEGASDTAGSEHDVRVAVCALLLDMARVDDAFSKVELDRILKILEERFGMNREHADALMAESERALKESIDYWQFTNLINTNYSTTEKIAIIEMLWQIIYADGQMDHHENYLVHKLAELLRLSHNQLIEAKLKVTRAPDAGA